MGIDLLSYTEEKPKRLKRLFWHVINAVVFPLVPNRYRRFLLCEFGAAVKPGHLSASARVFMPWKLHVDPVVCIGPRVVIYNKDDVFIGSNVVISQDAYLCTASHDVSSPTMALTTAPIRIEDNVWIAARATILPGVTIGEGAVVGACAVVAKDVPPWSIVVGNPARVVGTRTLKEQHE